MTAPSRGWVEGLIRAHDAAKARSQQVAIGPSEIGDPCDRRLAYRHLRVPEVNVRRDNLAAWVGTQAHAGIADALGMAEPGWQTEVEAMIWDQTHYLEIPCHIDAWHKESGTVVDWKFLGDTSMRKYRSRMSQQYIAQVNLYGLALARAGEMVNTVAIVLIPRNGGYSGIHVWEQPWDEAAAMRAISRLIAIQVTSDTFGRRALRSLERNPKAYCAGCPWWEPTITESDDASKGCPGYDLPAAVTVPGAWEADVGEGEAPAESKG